MSDRVNSARERYLAFAAGDAGIVTYEMTRREGARGRNTEILAFDGDRIVGSEVYFGWNL